MLVSAGMGLRFFVVFSRGRAKASSATAEDRQKEQADDEALEGTIASPPHHEE
jgi:hypothetical protein